MKTKIVLIFIPFSYFSTGGYGGGGFGGAPGGGYDSYNRGGSDFGQNLGSVDFTKLELV